MPVTTLNTTIEYFDGFDDYNTSQAQRYGWGEVTSNVNTGGTIATAGPFAQFSVGSGNGRTGNGLHCDNSGGFSNIITLGTQVTRTLGIAIKLTTFPQANNQACILTLIDTGVAQVGLRCNFDGTLSVVKAPGQGNGGTVLATSTQNLIGATWYYIEFSCTIGTSGSYTVKVNSVQWFTGTGNTKQTANSSANVVAIGGFCGNNPWKVDYDDFYSRADGTFCGDVTSLSSLPNGAGATTGWLASTGSNFQCVDDNPANDDTDYVRASSTGLIDLYTYPVIPTTGTVFAVMTIPIMKNDIAGSTTCVSQYRASSGTITDGGPQAVGSTSYSAYPDIQGKDPSTGSAWTGSGVNAFQFGVKRTA